MILPKLHLIQPQIQLKMFLTHIHRLIFRILDLYDIANSHVLLAELSLKVMLGVRGFADLVLGLGVEMEVG